MATGKRTEGELVEQPEPERIEPPAPKPTITMEHTDEHLRLDTAMKVLATDASFKAGHWHDVTDRTLQQAFRLADRILAEARK